MTTAAVNSTTLFSLDGKTALITGSTQGIGFALARGLASHGAHVVVNSRHADRVAKAVRCLQEEGLRASGLCFDVTDRQAVQQSIDLLQRDNGTLDILVNNAGMQYRAPLEDFPADRWEQLFQLNVSSVFHVSQIVARAMIARGSGKIVNIASIQSELARPGIAPYTATKGAIRNLTRGMATDWAPYGLQINAIAPGYFRTQMTETLVKDKAFSDWLQKRNPSGRWGDVEELVGAAVFLCSPASSFVNGQVIHVDGGMSICV